MCPPSPGDVAVPKPRHSNELHTGGKAQPLIRHQRIPTALKFSLANHRHLGIAARIRGTQNPRGNLALPPRAALGRGRIPPTRHPLARSHQRDCHGN